MNADVDEQERVWKVRFSGLEKQAILHHIYVWSFGPYEEEDVEEDGGVPLPVEINDIASDEPDVVTPLSSDCESGGCTLTHFPSPVNEL